MVWKLEYLILFLAVVASSCSPKKEKGAPQGTLKFITSHDSPSEERESSFTSELLNFFSPKLFPHYQLQSFESTDQALESFFDKHEGDVLSASFFSDSEDSPVLKNLYGEDQSQIYCQKTNDSQTYFCDQKNKNLTGERGHGFYLLSLDIGDKKTLVWLVREEKYGLFKAMQGELKKYQSILKIAQLDEKYHGHLGLFNKFDLYVLKKRYKRVYPRYKKYFDEAAKNYNLDPLFLAAMSYQESHWNPRAKSFTGVRGLMMLTLTTAKALGVKNRLDPKQSIQGGAKYYSRLQKRLPAEVKSPDRDWFALAAYNVGMGHLYDARSLTDQLGGNKNLWLDLKKNLPLLSQKKYYKKLKYGKARGHEPVKYVKSIRGFHSELQNLESDN